MIEILDVMISRNQDRDQGIEPKKSVGRSIDLLEQKMMYENIQHLQKTFNSQDLFIYFIKFKVTEDRKGTVNIA